jgi:hypothetical protein
MAVQFGKSGCSSITVEPFTPICSFEAPAGTTPLTFDVPAVSIAMPVPPAECQCFDFTSEATTTAVGVAGCGESGTASFDVEVVKADDDCCTGRYKVKTKGSVSVPCMPFTVSDSSVNVHSKSGSTAEADMDGSAEFYVRKGTGTSCCSLESGIDITFPDCKKGYDQAAIPPAQITFCDKGISKSARLIEMVQDTNNCTLYPRVTPVELPCCAFEDKAESFSFTVNGISYTGSLVRKDCAYSIDMPDITVNVPGVVIPDIPCFDTTSTYLKYKYSTDATDSGEAETTDNDGFSAEVKFSVVENENKCYKLEVGTLDLSKIKGGMDIVSGGHVYPVTDSTTDETKLYVDGSLDDSAHLWYAGGIGNAIPDTVGKLQGLGSKRGAVWPTTFGSQSTDDFVPYESGMHTHQISDGSETATAWRSDREAEKDNDPTTTLQSTGYATGTLVATVPTGFEWNARGVGIRLGEFVYNNAGVLSTYGEYYCDAGSINKETGWCSSGSGTDVIVAPGVSMVMYSGSSTNASGLVVYPTKQDSTTFSSAQLASGVSNLTSGLSVYPGNGLRIHGVTGMKPDKTKYGYPSSSSSNDTLTVADLGKLEVNVRNDDLAFTSDGRLGFNDKKFESSTKLNGQPTDAQGLYYKDTTLHTLDYVRCQGSDYTIPLLACPYVSTDWVQSGGFYNCDDLTTVPDVHLVYLHVSASGLIIGIDDQPDCSKVTRCIK